MKRRVRNTGPTWKSSFASWRPFEISNTTDADLPGKVIRGGSLFLALQNVAPEREQNPPADSGLAKHLYLEGYGNARSNLDEDALAVEKPHQAEPEQHVGHGKEQRGVDGAGQRCKETLIDVSVPSHHAACPDSIGAIGARHFENNAALREPGRKRECRNRVHAENHKRHCPTPVALDVHYPVD